MSRGRGPVAATVFVKGGVDVSSEMAVMKLELLELSHEKKNSLSSFSVDTLVLTLDVLQSEEDNCKKSGLFTGGEGQTVISPSRPGSGLALELSNRNELQRFLSQFGL